MVDFNRTEDKQAVVGTTVFYTLVLILFFILSKSCTTALAEDVESGGVAISLGEPDQGGPDNSSAQEESTPPPSVPDYTPQSQLTSDVDEAPEIKKTDPTPPTKDKPTKTDTKPTETTKKTETTEKVTKTVNEKSLFGKDKTGKGKGKDGRGGYTGRPDGTPDGSPDGNGGQGNTGTGPGSGPSQGPGVNGSISGFSAKITAPRGGVQDNGVVRLYVCVNSSGTVTTVKYAPLRGAAGTTTNSSLINRAKSSIQSSTFKNTSQSTGGCGHFTYTFKVR